MVRRQNYLVRIVLAISACQYLVLESNVDHIVANIVALPSQSIRPFMHNIGESWTFNQPSTTVKWTVLSFWGTERIGEASFVVVGLIPSMEGICLLSYFSNSLSFVLVQFEAK